MPRLKLNGRTASKAVDQASKVVSINRQAGVTSGPVYLRRAEVAARIGCSVRYLERLAQEGGGPLMASLGRHVVYPVMDLDAWLRARMVSSTSDASARQAAEATR